MCHSLAVLLSRLFLFLDVQFVSECVWNILPHKCTWQKYALYLFILFQPFHKNKYSFSVWIITSFLNNLPCMIDFLLFLTVLSNRSKNGREKKTVVFYVIYSLCNIMLLNDWIDFSNSNWSVNILESEQLYTWWTYKHYALQLNPYSLYTTRR